MVSPKTIIAAVGFANADKTQSSKIIFKHNFTDQSMKFVVNIFKEC